jgi:ATP-dependent RNA helicase RhlE
MLFEQLGLSAELLRAIHEQGYCQATPIQQQAIPLILEGQDVLAGAQTGTG